MTDTAIMCPECGSPTEALARSDQEFSCVECDVVVVLDPDDDGSERA